MERRSPPSVAFQDEHTNNLSSQHSPTAMRESAIPISPRTSFSSPRVITSPSTAQTTAPLAPRRPGPIIIPPVPSALRQSTSLPQPSTSSPNPPIVRSPRSPPPPRPARPDDSSKLYNPGWSHPFPSSQLGGTAPPRPARPARPAEALMFAAPQRPFADTSFPRTPEQNDGFEEGGVDLATFVEQEQPPPAVSPPLLSPVSPVESTSARKNSASHRKPVPRYIPSSSPAEPTTPGRLSVGGFEALIAKGEKRSASEGAAEPEFKRRMEENKPFSPRMGLGLDEGGVAARQQRQARDEGRSGPAVVGPTMSRGMSGDIGEENLSWSDRLRQSEWMPSAFAKRPTATLPTSPPLRTIPNESWRAIGGPTADIVHAYSHSRNPSADAFRPMQGINTPAQPRRRSAVAGARRKSEATEKDLQEVVVIPSAWDDDSDDEAEIKAREATFQPERMDFARVEYRSRFARLVHTLYPLFVLFHYPATLFLDYNVIYTLVQIAIHPTFPSTSANLVSRAPIDVPTLQASTAWWVAVGAYSLCTLLWFVVIGLWFDLVMAYIKPWSTGGRVPIARVYRGASSFNVACMSSYSRFCFLWRVRLAPFRKNSALARTVQGTRKSDAVAETCSWYSQNWPTVLLLLPRAGLSLAILLLFGTTAYGGPNENATQRDSAYFERNGTLTGFAQGVLLTNCAWAAYRLAIVLISALGLFCFNKPLRSRPEGFSSYYHPSREHLTLATTPSDFNDKYHGDRRRSGVPSWKLRRDRRLRAATISCLRVSAHSSRALSPTFKREPEASRTKESQEQEREARKQQREQKRLARLARQGVDWQDREDQIRPDVPQHTNQGGWGVVSPYVLPSPRVGSPLMTFSPASPPSEYPTTPALPSSANRNGREVTQVAIQSGPHRPEESDLEELREVRFNGGISAHRSPPPRPLSLRVDDDFTPGLKSHFSFISLDPSTPGAGTPLAEVPPPLFTRSTSTEVVPPITPRDQPREEEVLVFGRHPSLIVQPASPPRSAATAADPTSPQPHPSPAPSSSVYTPRQSVLTLGDRPSPGDIRYARHEVLQREITQGVIERRLLSERLLVEVQRLGEAEEAVRKEERRLAALRRISEAPSTSSAGAAALDMDAESARPHSSNSYTTANAHFSSTSDLAHDLNLPPPSPSSESDAPGLLLPPFRLSYGLPGSSTSSTPGEGAQYTFAAPESSPVSPNLEGEEFGVAPSRSRDDDEGESATAAFLSLSPTRSLSSTSAEDEEDDDDRSRTPRAFGRGASNRNYTVYLSEGGTPGAGEYSPGVIGPSRQDEEEQWTWRTSLKPLPRVP